MKCELCFDDCLDLPSLTQIQANQPFIHQFMGYVILESMIWFDLIWFDLIRHSKSHWKQHSLWRVFILLHCRFTSNKYFSISFLYSRFRCFCSRKCHSKKVGRLEKLENNYISHFTEKENYDLLLLKSSFIIITISFNT